MPSIQENPGLIEEFLYEVYEQVINYVSGAGLGFLAVAVALFALYAVHTLTVWLSGNPESAFHNARNLVGYASTGYNTYGTIKNVAVDLQREAIPVWNAAAKHAFEPAVWTAMEVISLTFLGRSHEGILPDTPYEGYVCDSTYPDGSDGAKWCAKANAYAAALGMASSTDSNIVANGSTLLLSTGQARRLQSIAGAAMSTDEKLRSGESLVGVLPIQPIIDVVHDVVGVSVIVASQIADIYFHVVYTILTELAKLIFNMLQVLIKALAGAALQLVQSGMLQTILKMGIDILLVLIFNVALPLLFAILDMVLCLLNLMQPATWAEQLQCSKPTQKLEPTTYAYHPAHGSCYAWLAPSLKH